MNHLYIRADATVEMGTGHIMRCIALAQAWKNKGGAVTFISHCNNKTMIQRIQEEGFDHISIEQPWPNTQDLQQTLKILQTDRSPTSNKPWNRLSWVVIDGYHFTAEYHLSIQKAGYKLLLIDDYHHLDHYHADIILNQNIGADRYHYDLGDTSDELLGTDYIMLRTEFRKRPEEDKKAQHKASNILVTLGGADAGNLTLTVIQALAQVNDSDLNVRVVIGPSNPNLESLTHAIEHYPCDAKLIQNADMPSLMSWADLAVTAGGSTCWELCFTGVPSLVISTAENQNAIVSGLNEAKAAINLGCHLTIKPDTITRTIKALIADPDKRNSMKGSGATLVDGKGTKRIIRQMIAGKLSLRPARTEDAAILWEWTNDAVVRSSSFHPNPIPWNEHRQWFLQKMRSNNSWIFMAENLSREPIGQIRFDQKENRLEISYSLAKEFRGIGLGKTLLDEGLKSMQPLIDLPTRIQGAVKTDNTASKSSFEKCGFTLSKQTSESHFAKNNVYQYLLHPQK